MIGFLRQVRGEITKVTFPAREDVIRLTVLVIVISIVVGIYLGALDFLFLQALEYLLG